MKISKIMHNVNFFEAKSKAELLKLELLLARNDFPLTNNQITGNDFRPLKEARILGTNTEAFASTYKISPKSSNFMFKNFNFN